MKTDVLFVQAVLKCEDGEQGSSLYKRLGRFANFDIKLINDSNAFEYFTTQSRAKAFISNGLYLVPESVF